MCSMKKQTSNANSMTRVHHNCSTGYWIVMTGYSHENDDDDDCDNVE